MTDTCGRAWRCARRGRSGQEARISPKKSHFRDVKAAGKPKSFALRTPSNVTKRHRSRYGIPTLKEVQSGAKGDCRRDQYDGRGAGQRGVLGAQVVSDGDRRGRAATSCRSRFALPRCRRRRSSKRIGVGKRGLRRRRRRAALQPAKLKSSGNSSVVALCVTTFVLGIGLTLTFSARLAPRRAPVATPAQPAQIAAPARRREAAAPATATPTQA